MRLFPGRDSGVCCGPPGVSNDQSSNSKCGEGQEEEQGRGRGRGRGLTPQ